jgi:putative CocE/NonD family hydrolase
VGSRIALSRIAVAAIGPLVVASGLVVTGPARAAAAGTTDPVTSYTKTADVRITMRDGISLDSDQYVPDHACPCPVILVQTPYRKNGGVAEFNPYFPAHGYAEIVVDVRGTGSSEGYWTSFGTPEQLDGVELVNWAAHRPFSNGKIGLAGVSYSAINQFLTVERVSELQPSNNPVQAIFPIVPMGDPYRDVVFAGGNTDTGFIPLWLGLVNSLNSLPADDAASHPAIALNAESQHLLDVAQFAAPAVADSSLGAYESALPSQLQTYPDQAYDNPYYRNVAPLTRIQDVHVPTFIVGGEYDLFQRSEPLLYRGLNLPPTQKKLLFGPWYHGNPSSQLTADDGSSPVYDQKGNLVPSTNNLSLAWFDHWLKGMNNGIDQFPTTETYQIGPDRWRPDSAFPYPGTTYQPWYLGASPSRSGAPSLYDGSLGLSAGAAGTASMPWQPVTGACSRSSAQWTAGIVAISGCTTNDSSSEITGVTFTSPVFKNAYTVSGPIVADLWLSSTRPDTTITATVGDVQTDGSTVFRVTAGSLVGSLRSVVATRCGSKVMDCSVYSGKVPVVPWHPYTHQSQQALTTAPTEALVEVFPTSFVVQPGHRLRLSLTTADLPHQGPNLSTLANSTGGVTTLYFGAKQPSRVYLGALPASAAAGAAGKSLPANTGAASTPAAPAPAASSRAGKAAEDLATGTVSPAQAKPSLRNTAAHDMAVTGTYGLVIAAALGVVLRRARRRLRHRLP